MNVLTMAWKGFNDYGCIRECFVICSKADAVEKFIIPLDLFLVVPAVFVSRTLIVCLRPCVLYSCCALCVTFAMPFFVEVKNVTLGPCGSMVSPMPSQRFLPLCSVGWHLSFCMTGLFTDKTPLRWDPLCYRPYIYIHLK